MIHVDTHVLIWMWEKKAKHAGAIAKHIDDQELVVSPAALLELQCIREIGRFKNSPDEVIEKLSETVGLSVSSATFADIALRGLSLSWTRDPFDRLIVANAAVDGAKLLTFDLKIHQHFKNAIG